MKQYKKRTLALVLASAISVVGAFGADNYKNSLVSLNFEPFNGNDVRVVLHTKQQFNGNINIIKRDASTYTIILPETNNEITEGYEIGENVESVDIATTPYTTSNEGYTKITIKTIEDTPLFAKTSLFIPAKQPEPIEIPTNNNNSSNNNYTESVNTIHSSNGVNQTAPIDIKESVKQFQTSEKPASIDKNIKPVTQNEKPEENHNKTREIFYWLLGGIFTLTVSIYLMLVAKEKIAAITGEQGNLDLSDEPKKEKDKPKKPTKINTTINNLDKKYSKPVKMPSGNDFPQDIKKTEPILNQEIIEEIEQPTVVDLDELLNEQTKNINTEEDKTILSEISNEENSSLEDFLSTFDFEEAEKEILEENNEDKIREELFNKYINDKDLIFSSDDIEKIKILMKTEISDDTIKFASEFLSNIQKEKKASPLERLENFVTAYTVKQNISFSKDDVDALYKLINTEIDNDFISDLKTNPERLKEMQAEILERKIKPHKSSEILTLNVKDMLPDLSKALKEYGNRAIESDAKPQVVYYSEGYEVSTLKLTDELPDLSKEIDNDEAYISRPSDEIEYLDTNYDVDKMSISNELPDLDDVLRNPEKYETPEPEPEEVDEEALLKNITNVIFKPFDDGNEFEYINDFDNDETPSVSDIQQEFKQLGDNFEIIEQEEIPAAKESENDDFEALYNNTDYFDLDKENKDNNIVQENLEIKEKTVVQEQNKPEVKEKDIEQEESKPETKENVSEIKNQHPDFCILDNKKYNIISTSNFNDKMGCYMAKNEDDYCIIGFVGDKTFEIKRYNKLDAKKLQSRICERLDDGTYRYIVRFGIHKFILDVKPDDMEFVMDLC